MVRWRAVVDEVNAQNAFWPILPGIEYAQRTSFYLDNFLFVSERKQSAYAKGLEMVSPDRAAPGRGAAQAERPSMTAEDEAANEAWWNFTSVMISIFVGTLVVQQYRAFNGGNA